MEKSDQRKQQQWEEEERRRKRERDARELERRRLTKSGNPQSGMVDTEATEYEE